MVLSQIEERISYAYNLCVEFLEWIFEDHFGARVEPTRSLDGDCGAEALASTVSKEVNMICYPPEQDPSLSSPWGDDDDDEATSV